MSSAKSASKAGSFSRIRGLDLDENFSVVLFSKLCCPPEIPLSQINIVNDRSRLSRSMRSPYIANRLVRIN